MFERFKKFVNKVVSKMLSKKIIQKEIDVNINISDDMASAIEKWINLYEDKPPWLDEQTHSMGIPVTIASEIARLVTVEFESEIIDNEYLNEQYQNFIQNIRRYVEYACAKGGLVFKPFFNGENIEVEFIQADNFFPVSSNLRGDITSAVFTYFLKKDNKLYTRLEYHELKGKDYYIHNFAYEKANYDLDNINYNNLGNQVPLNSIIEWSDIQPKTLIQNIDKPLFSYFKMPLANNIDDKSPLGVSVYSRAINLIEQLDRQYSRILWEYEGKELAVYISEMMLKINVKTNEKELPKGNARLYRILKGESDGDLYKEFSPEIRDNSLFNGLNELLRKIEFNCGLAYGTLSNINESDKTATEIKASKQRSYSTIKDIQNSLQYSLENLVYSMRVICRLHNLPGDKYDMSFNFDDSLVMDKDLELASMQADVAAGILRPEIYLSKKYGITEDEAIKMMPIYPNTSKEPFESEE